MFRVKSPQDFGAGVLFILIGIAGIYFARDLAFGTAARMGPGYFPTLLSALIVLVGTIVAMRGLVWQGPSIEPPQWRPLAFVLGAILLFGLLIDQIGLALTTVVLTLVAALARREVKWKEVTILGICMGVFAVAIFVFALGQPLPAFWGR